MREVRIDAHFCRDWGLALLVIIGFALLTASTAAFAFHESGHRTMVRGYVLDDNGSIVRNTRVSFSRDGIVVGSARTDFWGWYSAPIPAGSADVGQAIEVAARGQRGTFRLTATADSPRSVPVQHVSLVGGEVVTERLIRFRIPFWVYPVLGLFALLFGAFSFEKWRRRRRRRQQRASAAAAPAAVRRAPAAGKRSGKRRR